MCAAAPAPNNISSAHASAQSIGLYLLQCGQSSKDLNNFYNAEKIHGGATERPCAVSREGRPAADHAGEMVAGLAAAATMFRDTNPTLATRWMASAKAVYAWARKNPGTAKEWLDDVRCSPGFLQPNCPMHALCPQTLREASQWR
jgi:hypothetical protein